MDAKLVNEFLEKVIKHDQAIQAASDALLEAQQAYQAFWKESLSEYYYDEAFSELEERVIVRQGACIYEIKFDIDDFTSPEVKRVENWTSFVDLS